MKKTLLLLTVVCLLFSCKKEQSTELNATELKVEDKVTIRKDFKIKSVTRKDFLADYKYGKYIQGEQINFTKESFNEESLPFEVEIEIMDPSLAKVAGDSTSKKDGNDNVFKYIPKKNGDKIELYGVDGNLAEIYIKNNNTLFGYTVENDEEPFVIRQFDDIGNYIYQVINTGDEYLYVTKHNIVEKDANGFATKSNALWLQYEKRDDIDYNNLDFSQLKVVDKNYQVVEFKYELY
ncbi:hypothetical protein [Pseudofulvibacter geojedonensis]|uniref:Lipoprotein n=1 Tax=Pseudofulvibacter geojedonensis TaxID=1123758 RepID=A0ABW3HZ48_9FLAO